MQEYIKMNKKAYPSRTNLKLIHETKEENEEP